MQFAEFIDGLNKMFPTQRERIDAMIGAYRRVLGDLSPPDLRKTWEATIDRWKSGFPPMPAEFADHRPPRVKPATDQENQVYERLQLTKVAEVEKKRLVDRTLEHYAETLNAYARDFHPDFKREVATLRSHGQHYVTGPDIFRHCALYLIQKRAWPLACETARSNRGFAYVELGHADWQDIHAHAETRINGWSQKAVLATGIRVTARHAEQLRQLAKAHHGEAESQQEAM
jgi:hypothetical protein